MNSWKELFLTVIENAKYLPKKLRPPFTPFLTPYRKCGVRAFFSSGAEGAIFLQIKSQLDNKK